jgi:hypothetical protein
LWDAFVREEMRLETISSSYEDGPELALIGNTRKGGKKARFEKGRKKKEDSRSSN